MKRETVKKIMAIFFFIVSIIAIYYLIPFIKYIATEEGRILFRNKINSLGFLGFILLLFIQVLQIIIAVIPGEPIEILAGMCFGNIYGTIFVLLTLIIVSTIVFILVRKYGRKVINIFVSDEKIDKLLNKPVFKKQKKIELAILLFYLIPGTPKDIMIYIAGLLPIDGVYFIVISNIARLPSVVSSVIVGSNLIAGSYSSIFIIYLCTFLLIGLALFIINKLDKDKIVKDIFKTIE